MKVDIIKPCGFCSGVANAIKLAKEARDKGQFNNYYTFGKIVHNDNVVNELKNYGIVALNDDIESLGPVTTNDLVIFTAHGHKVDAEEYLNNKGIKWIDAICPIVKRNRDFILSINNPVIYIGYKNHPETKAIMSLNKDIVLYDCNDGFITTPDISNPVIISQTTISILDQESYINNIRKRYRDATVFESICSVTYDRQKSVINLDNIYDLVVIIGSSYSSNSTKLFNIASKKFSNVIMVNNLDELKNNNIDYKNINNVALISGASTSIEDVNEIKEYLENE